MKKSTDHLNKFAVKKNDFVFLTTHVSNLKNIILSFIRHGCIKGFCSSLTNQID